MLTNSSQSTSDTAEYLISECYKQSQAALLSSKDFKGNTPLHLWIRALKVEIIASFVQLASDGDKRAVYATTNQASQTPQGLAESIPATESKAAILELLNLDLQRLALVAAAAANDLLSEKPLTKVSYSMATVCC